MILSLALTIVLVRYQRYVAKETGSIAISADSVHYVTDILINVGIILGLLAVALLNWRLADPLIAISVAAYLVYAAKNIAVPSLDILMDRELKDEERRQIVQIVTSHPDVHAMHDLRTRTSGVSSFIQFHLELDGSVTLDRAHEIADEVEEMIAVKFPGSEILIHQDPAGLVEERPDFA